MAFSIASTTSFAAKASYSGVNMASNPVAAPRMAPSKGPVLVNMAFWKKKAAPTPAPVSKNRKKQVAVAAPAQSFNITIPGELFQARNNIQIPVELGFTKANELFVGRVAMIGFAASLLGEALTGMGALAQFDIETGLPLADTEPLIIGIALFNVFVAFGGVVGLSSGKFKAKSEEDLVRTKFDATKSLARPKEFFGITGFGFSKENELFVGRLAQLGFAASLVGEAITGLGPLAQFGLETGIPLSETEPILIASIVLLGTLAINEGTGSFEEDEE
jgi:photosystem II protein